MKTAKWLKRLSGICFLLLWVPFAVIMLKGPLSIAIYGSEEASRNLHENFFLGTGPWIVLVMVFAIGSAFFLVASVVASSLSNRRVLANGRDAEARILAIRDTGTRINHNPQVDISLEVRPPDLPPFVAQTRQTVSVVQLPVFQPGNLLYVKYIPGTDQVAIVGVKHV